MRGTSSITCLFHQVFLVEGLGRYFFAGCLWLSFRDMNQCMRTWLSQTRFIQEIDWTDGVYGVLPTAKPLEVLKAIDKMLVMGAAMDPEALKAGVLAHSKAIKSIDGKGVTTLADYTATNAAIGHMIASVPASKTMDVYNAFNKFSLGKDVGPYMMSKVSAEDAKAAYKAFLEFKDVVKASQR